MNEQYKNNWRSRLFTWWGGICYDHAWAIVAAVALITLFFSYFAATIEINLGMMTLLEEKDPLVKRVDDANKNFGGLDYLTIGLTTPDDQPPDKEKLIRYANKLAPLLRARTDLVSRVTMRVDFDQFLRWAPRRYPSWPTW